MTNSSDSGGRGRGVGRPRDEAVRPKVLAATLELLAERGYRGLRADAIANLSGVPKSTIYRRWPSLTRLAIDALDESLGERRFEPSDDPEDDARRLMSLAHQTLIDNPLGRVMHQIAIELSGDSEVAEDYRHRIIDPLRNAGIEICTRGIRQGIWQAKDPSIPVDMMIGMITYRDIILGQSHSEAETMRALDVMFDILRTPR